MTNKEKFLALISEDDQTTIGQVKWRIQNRELLKESQKIALQVLKKLDALGWDQTDLAREMGISSQQVSLIVSGKETLSPEIQNQLKALFGISNGASQ